MPDKVKVPKEVLRGLEAVRESGKVNMFDRPGVVKVAWELGFQEAGSWIIDYYEEYAQGVFYGFMSIEEEEVEI